MLGSVNIETYGCKKMKLVRYKQLVADGIVENRVSLARQVRLEGFPKPICIGPNTLAWDYDEVTAWVASRPRREMKIYPAKACSERTAEAR